MRAWRSCCGRAALLLLLIRPCSSLTLPHSLQHAELLEHLEVLEFSGIRSSLFAKAAGHHQGARRWRGDAVVESFAASLATKECRASPELFRRILRTLQPALLDAFLGACLSRLAPGVAPPAAEAPARSLVAHSVNALVQVVLAPAEVWLLKRLFVDGDDDLPAFVSLRPAARTASARRPPGGGEGGGGGGGGGAQQVQQVVQQVNRATRHVWTRGELWQQIWPMTRRVLRSLLSHGARLDLRMESGAGATVLHLAAELGHPSLVRFLLREAAVAAAAAASGARAFCTATDALGRTAADVARAVDARDIAVMLDEACEDLDPLLAAGAAAQKRTTTTTTTSPPPPPLPLSPRPYYDDDAAGSEHAAALGDDNPDPSRFPRSCDFTVVRAEQFSKEVFVSEHIARGRPLLIKGGARAFLSPELRRRLSTVAALDQRFGGAALRVGRIPYERDFFSTSSSGRGGDGDGDDDDDDDDPEAAFIGDGDTLSLASYLRRRQTGRAGLQREGDVGPPPPMPSAVSKHTPPSSSLPSSLASSTCASSASCTGPAGTNSEPAAQANPKTNTSFAAPGQRWYAFDDQFVPTAFSDKELGALQSDLARSLFVAAKPLLELPRADFRRALHQSEDLCVEFAVGPPGSGAPIHYHQVAVNFLLAGRKRWWLLPPAHRRYSRQPVAEWVSEQEQQGNEGDRGSPLQQCVQERGDVLLVPHNWAHAVLNIPRKEEGKEESSSTSRRRGDDKQGVGAAADRDDDADYAIGFAFEFGRLLPSLLDQAAAAAAAKAAAARGAILHGDSDAGGGRTPAKRAGVGGPRPKPAPQRLLMDGVR